ncbi:uncharacterized protein LOC126839486 isoform X2 [Adelges cooleyi]|uniref:uncharacterized protein LOC126839486 isoform X2 n=1 Tax=Adelges cooleyi TaxID=133065 RepID=UPI00217FFDC9|nr:uncharacterized protein LOC126839486 isoform X2 [Adelges cooleyi]
MIRHRRLSSAIFKNLTLPGQLVYLATAAIKMLTRCVVVFLFVCVEIATGTPPPNPPTFYPNLPMGNYKYKIKAVQHCDNPEKYKIQFNLYISKKSPTESYLMGNLTFLIPLDDTLSLFVNMAVKGSIGGWKENAHVYQSPAACSKVRWLIGNIFDTLTKEFHVPEKGCPAKAGVFVTPGFDLDKFKDNNFPKTFFYGEYKMKFSFKNKAGEIVGCTSFQVDVIRPWED